MARRRRPAGTKDLGVLLPEPPHEVVGHRRERGGVSRRHGRRRH